MGGHERICVCCNERRMLFGSNDLTDRDGESIGLVCNGCRYLAITLFNKPPGSPERLDLWRTMRRIAEGQA